MKRTLGYALCILVATAALAGDGATPVWAPTTITQPGKYVLTRDITSAGIPITVNSDDVTLDLNGFQVKSTTTTAIYLQATRRNVGIRNGRIVSLQHYGVSAGGEATGIVIAHNRIEGSGGVYIASGSGNVVHRNQLQIGDSTKQAIGLGSARNTEISENTITCIGTESSWGIHAGGSHDNLIRDNRIVDCRAQGITVGSGSLVLDNAIETSAESGIAISVEGDYNHIEGNLMTGSKWGLVLYGASNVYRRNTARGNSLNDFDDNGSDNTSHGDNYMPNQM